jgi:hypothetical protein
MSQPIVFKRPFSGSFRGRSASSEVAPFNHDVDVDDDDDSNSAR